MRGLLYSRVCLYKRHHVQLVCYAVSVQASSHFIVGCVPHVHHRHTCLESADAFTDTDAFCTADLGILHTQHDHHRQQLFVLADSGSFTSRGRQRDFQYIWYDLCPAYCNDVQCHTNKLCLVCGTLAGAAALGIRALCNPAAHMCAWGTKLHVLSTILLHIKCLLNCLSCLKTHSLWPTC